MRRRGWTVAVGVLLLAMLTLLVMWAKVPYVALGPGPTVDTLSASGGDEVIEISGREASDSAGQLRLTTVNVVDRLTVAEALYYWFADNNAVVPRELVYPPDKSAEEVDAEQKQQFKQSQTSAETAALRALGFAVQVAVVDVADGSPAAGKLAAGDVITTVNGGAVTSVTKLNELVAKGSAKTRTIGYLRSGKPGTATLTLPGGDTEGIPGLKLEQRQPHPFSINIELDRIGGPSAGLMFALGIVDKLEPADLTGGMTIAGTGTINDEGDVGPIGGVPQKLIAAKRDGASVFLTPEGNCAEASRNVPGGLKLVKVGNLADALSALEALRDKRTPPLCTR